MHPLDADPRGLAPETCDETPRRREPPPGRKRPGLLPPAGARRNGIDTVGFEPGDFGVPWGSGDISGGRVFGAIDGLPRDIQDCNIELGDEKNERVSRIP
jgi:hypothetical protein